MGATLKIYEDFYDDSFTLLGIHTTLEDYALVYELNRFLGLRLKRSGTDLDVTGEISYPIFEWKDELHHRNWTLLVNACKTVQQPVLNDLFPNEPSYSMHHLVPEHKDVDYLLKIDEEEMGTDILKEILTIPKVITAYDINTDTLKSKHNLIF